MNFVRLIMPTTVVFTIVNCTAYDPGLRDWRGQVEIVKEDSKDETESDSSVGTESDSRIDVPSQQIVDSNPNKAEGKDSSQSVDSATDADNSKCELDNATAERVEGECVIDSCDDGYGDCDQDDSTGCETRLDGEDHCGACDIPCKIENATASCRAGKCELENCDKGFADCNGDPRDGCETSLDTWRHCGTCDNLCTMPETGSVTCEDGECIVTECEPGLASCSGDPNSSCETRIDTMQHCGSCSRRCNENTSDRCDEGTCVCGELGRRCAMWECCWEQACWPWPCIPGL